MNILILTPTNEVDITIFSRKIHGDYDSFASLFSLQEMALLMDVREKQKHPDKDYIWRTFEYATGLTIREDSKILRDRVTKSKQPYIIFGNIPKDVIKFDHIISIAEPSWDWDNETSERAEGNKVFNPVVESMKHKPLEWYSAKDVQLTLPTYHHLQLFLKALGIGGKKVGK